MKRIILFGLVFMLSLPGFVMAQKTVTGSVTAEDDGTPVPGVNVIVKGTGTGTVTSIDGTYQIEVPSEESILVFSFIGLATEEVEVGNQSVIDMVMTADIKQLTEVVVVGYGTTTRQSFAGSMKEVDSEMIQRKSVPNISQALAGEVAGVNVVVPSGQPGSNAIVRIRGIGSVNGNSSPLYVVDGVPYFGSINAINPADIESTTVLKDATATAIYGSRGANGVILINTRKGTTDQSFIEVDAKVGQNFSALPRYPTISSPEEYVEIGWNSLYNRGVADGDPDPAAYANANLFSGSGIDPFYNMWDVPGNELIDPATGRVRSGVNRIYDPEDWEDYAFQPSTRVEGNVRIGGGNEKTNYFMSVGYLDDVGYSINSDFQRISTRLNVNHQVKEWLSGGFNIGYSASETNNGGQSEDSGSIFWFVDNIPPIFPLFLRDENGEKIPDPYYGGFQYDYGESRGFGGLTNAISDAVNTVQNRKSHDLNGNANLAVDFYDDLRFESRFGWQYYNSNYDELNSPFYGPSASTNGSIYKTKTEIFTYNFTNLLRYNKNFGDNEIEVLAAHESNSWRRSFLTGFKQQLVDPFSTEFNNAVVTNPSTSYTDDYSIESYFAQANYNYQQKYFLTGSVRRDGSSRFVKDKWGTFGSVGVAWVLTGENFMSGQNVFDFLKLKASYGITGDQAGVGYYPGYDLFEISNLDGTPSLTFDTKGNPDLTWETSKMFQAGLEFRVGRWLDANIDYYLKNTDNLIFDRRVGPSIGYALITVNDGQLRNSGIEFDLTGHLVKTRDFYLDLSINGEILQNELTTMPLDPATGEEKVLDISGRYGRAVGRSIYDYYMREWAGVDPTTGQAQWNLYFDDKDGDGEVSEGEAIRSLHEYLNENPNSEANIKQTTTYSYQQATQKFVGKSAIPTVRGAINLAAGFKGIDFSVLLRYGLGGYSYDFAYADLMRNDQVGGNNWHTDIRDRWQAEGDVTEIPRLSNDLDQNYTSTSTRFLLKSDYLNLTNIQLGYTFPSTLIDKIGLQSLRLFVAGDNLLLLSGRDGFNPTTNVDTGTERYTYDPLSTVTGGLNIKF